MKDISIPSAGHHDKDPGALGNGYKESEITILIRDSVIHHLAVKQAKYESDKDWETNTQYQNRIRSVKGKVVLDIHLNAATPSANGSEVIISNNASTLSKSFAKEILDTTCNVLGTRNRGVLTESQTPRKKLGILNMSGLAALIEVCFITNKNEMDKLMSKGTIDKLGEAYANIMIKYDEIYNP